MTAADLDKKSLDVAGLQEILQAVDPGVVLVSSRILERVIREAYDLPNMYWNIPHNRSFVCPREVLFRHAEQADLELKPDQILPDTVILLLKPDAEELSTLERPRLLLKYWRRLFHSRVHLALEHATALHDDAIRERVEQIGRTEFEEIRTVLVQDRYLPPDPNERRTFVEFAAVYLELRYFAANLLRNFFPGIREFARIERLLARDINSAELFVKTRLRGAPDPVMAPETRSDESQEAYWKLVRTAQRAQSDGNMVRAAILRTRASRIAPAALTLPTRLEAEKNIAELTQRLALALHLNENEAADWKRHLTLLLEKADQGAKPTEADVLFELQNVCLANEREVFTLDLVDYLGNMGKRPIKRPLPSQKFVRTTRHLRAATGKLTEVRLSDSDRTHLDRLMQSALKAAEDRLKAQFSPVLITAMQDMGLKPRGPLEKAAFDKMVAELLDRIIRYGFLSFSELRDTISRNQLKLPDVSEPEHFLQGDPLIRLDRRLGSLLNGVYRPGEFYVRWLERLNSLSFGTPWGRWFTSYVAGPLLFAWLILFVLGLILEEFDTFFLQYHPERVELSRAVQRVVQAFMGPAHSTKGGEAATAGFALLEDAEQQAVHGVPRYWHVGVLVFTSFILIALMYNAPFRQRVSDGLVAIGRALRWLFWSMPLRLLPITAVQKLINTWVFQLLYWYLLKPGAITGVFVLLIPALRKSSVLTLLLFFVVAMMVNTRQGRIVSEGVRDAFLELAAKLRVGLLMSLVRFTLYVFKQVIEFIEYVLFSVDEWLRFRSGDSKSALVVRTMLSLLWAPVAFLTRFYMVVLIEPGYNPLKAPVSYLAAKIMAPLTVVLMGQAWEAVSDWPAIVRYPVYALLVVTIFHLCDVFGFLVWEMKENWSLYRSNRGEAIAPVQVGAHGETIRGLLQPGFHSGTVPTLFSRLREAERQAVRTRNWQNARYYAHEVKEVEEALARFLARDVVALLRSARCFENVPVEAGAAHLATNRIRFEFAHAGHPDRPVQIEIEHNSYWILAGIRSIGWLDEVTPEQRQAFTTCLAGMYKLADVDLVREQMMAAEGGPVAAARLTYEGVQVWREAHGQPTTYELRKKAKTPAAKELLDRFVFARTPIAWAMWQECWRKDSEGEKHPGLPGVNELVLPGVPSPATSGEPGGAG